MSSVFSFLEPVSEPVYAQTLPHLLLSLGIMLGSAVFMMGIYRLCHNSLTYQKRFNILLFMLAFLSTLLLFLMQNNPLLSLGVLGSLSICRIRTNTKDPRDLGFVFWALSIGMASAVGAFSLSVLGSLLLGAILLVLHRGLPKPHRLMIVVRGERVSLSQAQALMQPVRGGRVQSKTVYSDAFELVYEIPDRGTESILRQFEQLDGISGVNILAPESKV